MLRIIRLPSYVGTNSLSDLSGSISPGSTTVFVNGVWSGSVTITKARTGDTITTTGSSKSGVSNSFNVVAGALDHFVIANIASPKTAGVGFSITIAAVDASNNTVTSYAGTNTLSDLTSSISPTSTGAFVNGVWSGSVTITVARTADTITTTGGGKSGMSNSFNVVAGAVDHFVIAFDW